MPLAPQHHPQILGVGRSIAMLLISLLWATLLGFWADVPAQGIVLLTLEAWCLNQVLRLLAGPAQSSPLDVLFITGLVVYTLQTLILRSLPPWTDTFPDSVLYDLHANALLRHWEGESVDAATFRLKGLMNQGIATWLPGDSLSYGEVLGSSRYLYQWLVAQIYVFTDGSRTTVLFTNLPLLAGMAGGVYLLADALFGHRRVAWLAAGLVMLDSNFALWGSILLREALLMLLVVLALLGGVRLLRRMGPMCPSIVLSLITLSLLALIRFNAVASFLLAAGIALAAARRHLTVRRALAGLAAIILLVLAAVHGLPESSLNGTRSLPLHIMAEHLKILKSTEHTLTAATSSQLDSQAKMDSVRLKWHQELQTQPLWLTGLKAVSRSLMGPYPWVALTHGIAGDNFYELMYPGMTLWLLFLPLFLLALWRLPIADDPAVLLCSVWLLSEAIIYVIGYGEFSGRERMMAQPLLWVFAARGMAFLRPTGIAREPAA